MEHGLQHAQRGIEHGLNGIGVHNQKTVNATAGIADVAGVGHDIIGVCCASGLLSVVEIEFEHTLLLHRRVGRGGIHGFPRAALHGVGKNDFTALREKI